jgi:hypothetical protein
MAMTSVSIAVMTVTSRRAITRKAPVNDKLFSAELSYQVSLALAENLLQGGTISEEDFLKMRALLREKYKPVLGSLFAEFG